MVPRKCPLMNLPAELRINIWENALAPGMLCMTSTETKRCAITPTIAPALLRVCRQIYLETKELLYSNEITFVADAHDTCWPTISEKKLPQYVLERLPHICVALDCTANFRASYEDVDFTAFEAFTSLETLRIGVLHDSSLSPSLADLPERCSEMLTEVLIRVPKAVRVTCGIDTGTDQAEFVDQVLETRRKSRGGAMAGVFSAMPVTAIEAALAFVDQDIRGTKSGGNSDVFAEYHVEPGSQWQRFGTSH